MKRIGVLISGSGTNLQAIIDACKNEKINGEVVCVVSNKSGVYGLERAEQAGIKNEVIKNSKDDFELIHRLKEEKVDLVVLAGYLKVLSQNFIKQFKHKIINIHPSLIPSFCGDGYYGMYVHEAVWERGAKCSGATVHFVDEGTDTGPIIMQKPVSIVFEDSPEDIQRKVLQIEHEILVESVSLFCENNLVVEGNRVKILKGDRNEKSTD